MKLQVRTATSAAAFLFVFAFATPPVGRAAATADSESVSNLLSEAKTQAFQVREDASTLETYTRMTVGWESHAATVTQMREHINALGRQSTKLDEAKASASPWQAAAIDRIRPLLKELASNTENTINLLNKNKRQLTTGAYKEYVEANADMASRLAEMIGDFVDYGKTKDRFEKLSKKLELPTSE